MREKLKMSYDLSKFHKPGKPVSISSFTIREVDGADEELASKNQKAKGVGTVYEELVRLSLTEVDGQPVNQDGLCYAAYDGWNSRTRGFLLTAFRNLNGIDEKEELGDFLSSGAVK
jgi:hypothetical protein